MQNNKTILSFSIISAAVDGDIDAINTILKRYEGYITCLSTRRLHDENGNSYMVIDEEMRRRLETKLITKILKFKLA